MNWYSTIKIADLVPQYVSGEIDDAIHSLYEIEYKYSMLKQKPFNGHPKRYENIMKILESNFVDVAEEVKSLLIEVYEYWLSNHALLDPMAWGKARVIESLDSDDFSYVMNNMVSEFEDRSVPSSAYNMGYGRNQGFENFKEAFFDLIEKESSTPALINFKKSIYYGQKEYLRELFMDDTDEFNSIYDTEFTIEDQDEAEEFIENLQIDDIRDLMYFEDVEGLKDTIYRMNDYTPYYIDPEEFLIEVYSGVIFPLWRDEWVPQGIEKTRKGVEQTYELLKSANPSDMGDMSAKINVAINQAHQTGGMSDHIDQRTGSYGIAQKLNELTQGKYVEEWNNELREIGVVI